MADGLPVIGEAWIRGDVPDGTARQQLVWILYGPEPWNACRILEVTREGETAARTVLFAATNRATGRYSVQRWPLDKFVVEWRALGGLGDEDAAARNMPRG